MKSQKLSFSLFLFFFFSLLLGIVHSSAHSQKDRHNHGRPFSYGPLKLFVFGDSYVDTGNTNKTTSESWKTPYGMTWPGIPTGRFSDGHVLTDFFAEYLGGMSPIPYAQIHDMNQLKYGVNFAVGGTGVFVPLDVDPNMTEQINFFQQLIKNYTVEDLNSSVALVSLNGNDYAYYFFVLNVTLLEMPVVIKAVVNQLEINLKRIHTMGVKNIAVTNLAPLGCFPFPQATAGYSFKQCDEPLSVIVNILVDIHNILLKEAIDNLNNGTQDSPFVLLDLHRAFDRTIESNKFEDILKHCCTGINSTYRCGDVDKNGDPLYTLCENPNRTLLWDGVHPTQEGWKALISRMLPSF